MPFDDDFNVHRDPLLSLLMKYGFRRFYKRLRSFFCMIPVRRDNRFSCGRRGFLFGSVRFSKSLLQGEGISGKHRFHQWWRFRHRARRQPREVPVLQRGRGAVLFIAFDAERFCKIRFSAFRAAGIWSPSFLSFVQYVGVIIFFIRTEGRGLPRQIFHGGISGCPSSIHGA